MGMDPLGHYSDTATRSAGVVIGSYSTSFGLACWILGPAERRHIENIYALVRVADEVVDGAAAAAGLDADAVCWQLDNDFAFVAQCNLGGEAMTEADLQRQRQTPHAPFTSHYSPPHSTPLSHCALFFFFHFIHSLIYLL